MGYSTGKFKDWAGQEINYRLRATRGDEEYERGDWMTCEIDPHKCDQWQVMGRGKTSSIAVSKAKAAWDSFDQER